MFAGNHADIGGSYPENESRLSDIALGWMVDFVTNRLPEEARLSIDDRYLKLYPSSDGMMHDECMVGIGGLQLTGTQEIETHRQRRNFIIPLQSV